MIAHRPQPASDPPDSRARNAYLTAMTAGFHTSSYIPAGEVVVLRQTTQPEQAFHRCEYCGQPIPLYRPKCENCGGAVPEKREQRRDSIDELLRDIDVSTVLRHPATITVFRQSNEAFGISAFAMMIRYFLPDRVGVWIVSHSAEAKIYQGLGSVGCIPLSSSMQGTRFLGYPIVCSPHSPHFGLEGDVALIDWETYHELDGRVWPAAPILGNDGDQISPFVVLGECW